MSTRQATHRSRSEGRCGHRDLLLELPMTRYADAKAQTDFDPTDPKHLTPEQRLDELCALLATGTRRLIAGGAHISIATPHTSPGQIPGESSQIELDESPEL